MKSDLFDLVLAARLAKRAVALVTHLADGRQAVVNGGTSVGSLSLSPEALGEIRRLHLLPDCSGVMRADEQLFVRVYSPTPRLLIVGAVHIAQALAPMAAVAGFQVTIIDPRRAFASAERFPGITLNGDWPDEAMTQLAPDARTAVVALSHDPKIDDPALAAALDSSAFYIGALGSSRSHAQRLARLQEAGYTQQLSRIHAPVGLDLGGRAPAEIAVSILAQLIQARYQKAPQ
jgi:xanthine dehydrogenase accessory factor